MCCNSTKEEMECLPSRDLMGQIIWTFPDKSFAATYRFPILIYSGHDSSMSNREEPGV